MSSEDEDVGDMEYRPETPEEVKAGTTQVIPSLSRDKYNKVYDDFQKWVKLNGTTPVSENVLMKYFLELTEKSKPSTLWVYYSMLKATLRLNDDIDISSYATLLDFLKRTNVGYKPVKSRIFEIDELETFLNAAPDDNWLHLKAVCIFKMNGVRSSNQLVNVGLDQIKQYDDLILVTMPRTENSAKRTFTLTGTSFDVVKKYIALRPETTKDNRLFLNYRDGKCKALPIGRNKFYEIPRRIAKYLKLPEPERYSANSFPKNKTTAANDWSSSNVSEDQVSYSLDYETGLLKTSIQPSNTSLPAVRVSSNKNDNANEHVCTISCGQVKCVMDGHEMSVLHAFTIMKPVDYSILEVTPALFPVDPICRWIVAYTHINEPVSSFNADETFKDITRSTPNNVVVLQRYIRKESTHMLAAYVVVYGVNCRCEDQSSGAFSFSANEIKFEI